MPDRLAASVLNHLSNCSRFDLLKCNRRMDASLNTSSSGTRAHVYLYMSYKLANTTISICTARTHSPYHHDVSIITITTLTSAISVWSGDVSSLVL